MRINTQFPVALHVLAVLAYFEDRVITSEDLARSVGTNPVVIRRTVSALKKAGLVDARAGVKGTTLCRRPEAITLLDVYHAVRQEDDVIFDLHPNPSRSCRVGAHIQEAVAVPLMSAQRAMEENLTTFTLQDVMKTIWAKNGLEGR